jgi:hypothetical protein
MKLVSSMILWFYISAFGQAKVVQVPIILTDFVVSLYSIKPASTRGQGLLPSSKGRPFSLIETATIIPRDRMTKSRSFFRRKARQSRQTLNKSIENSGLLRGAQVVDGYIFAVRLVHSNSSCKLDFTIQPRRGRFMPGCKYGFHVF